MLVNVILWILSDFQHQLFGLEKKRLCRTDMYTVVYKKCEHISQQ